MCEAERFHTCSRYRKRTANEIIESIAVSLCPRVHPHVYLHAHTCMQSRHAGGHPAERGNEST